MSILLTLPLIRRLLCSRPRLLDGVAQVDDFRALVNRIVHCALHGRPTAHDSEKVFGGVNTPA